LTEVPDRTLVDPDNVSLWQQLLLFGCIYFGLDGERPGGKRHSSSLTTKVDHARFVGIYLKQQLLFTVAAFAVES
jgi:hypothetical protein